MREASAQFLGSGDAFGNRGRFQSCIHVRSGTTHFLIDCGAASLIAMKHLRPDLALIDTVPLTHLMAILWAPVSHYGSPLYFTTGKVAGRGRTAGTGGQDKRSSRIHQAESRFSPVGCTVETTQSFGNKEVSWTAR
jgi:hypothetical protein